MFTYLFLMLKNDFMATFSKDWPSGVQNLREVTET